MLRVSGALAIYVALMGSYLAELSALQFALYSAVLLALGLVLHSVGHTSVSQDAGSQQPLHIIGPSLSESMAELHVLQKDINALQAQFAAESSVKSQGFESGRSAS